MAYDPERTLKYCIEQSRKEKEEKERRKQAEYNASHANNNPKERSLKERMYVDADHPSTIDNGTATIWYIIIMVVGAVFNDRVSIWIIATVIWWRHINRKSRRQKEWDEKHKENKT